MSLNEGEKQNAEIPKKMGCSNKADPKATVACMKSQSIDEIKKVVPSSWDSTSGLWGFPPAEAAHNPRGLDVPGKLSIYACVYCPKMLPACESVQESLSWMVLL